MDLWSNFDGKSVKKSTAQILTDEAHQNHWQILIFISDCDGTCPNFCKILCAKLYFDGSRQKFFQNIQ